MRVLFLGNSDTGLYLFRREIIVELINIGHKVFASVPDGRDTSKIQFWGCPVIITAMDRRGINPIHDIKLLVA